MPLNLNLNPQADTGQVELRWNFAEPRAPERGQVWWILMSLVGVGLIIYAVLTASFLFALIIVLGAAILVQESRRPRRRLDCKITNTGVAVGKKFWKWSELHEFFIVYRPPEVSNLYIVPNALHDPRVKVPLEKTNPLKVRDILIKYLKENLEREDIPTSEAISKLLKLQ